MAVAGEQVSELLEQLRHKLSDINGKITQDQMTKDTLERQLVKYTDDLEDLENLMAKQKKLYKSYNNNIDETEMALKALNNSAKKFGATYVKIAQKE